MDIVFVFLDGSELPANCGPPYTPVEQHRWETEFGLSFLAVEQAVGEETVATLEGRPADPRLSLRVGWMLWLGWERVRHRLQGPAAVRFASFAPLLSSWRFPTPDPVDSDGQAGEAGEPEAVEPAAVNDADLYRPAQPFTGHDRQRLSYMHHRLAGRS